MDAKTIAELNVRPERRVPPLAAWQADFDGDLDMSLLDFDLSQTPWERISEKTKRSVC